MMRLVFIVSLLVLPLVAGAEVRTERPYETVRYFFEQVQQPVPQKIHVAAVDLTPKNVSVRVSRGGEDPDGPGKWQTMLMRPTKIADREEFDVVINGDFFSHLSGKDAEGAAALAEFKAGIPAAVSGPAVTDGELWGPAGNKRAAFLVDANKRMAVAEIKDPPPEAMQVIAGSHLLVTDGKNVAPEPTPGFSRGPHPRTAVGIADGGKTLVMVVVDGRKPGQAVGMSLKETAEVMLKYGCSAAVNLDGGGSSMMAVRDPRSGQMKIVNNPSDGRERAVGNVLGVTVKKRPQK